MQLPKFSRKGEPPTSDEIALIAAAAADPTNHWALLATRISIESLCIVLDELGGEKPHVPTREQFVRALWAPIRLQAMRALRPELSYREIGEMFHVDAAYVHRVLTAADDGQHPEGQSSRA